MPQPINLPELGENIEEAEVLTVLVSVGDHITKDQAIIEVETEKASIEVPTPISGVVTAIRVKPGDAIRVGQVLIDLDSQDGADAGQKAPSSLSDLAAHSDQSRPEAPRRGERTIEETPTAGPSPAVPTPSAAAAGAVSKDTTPPHGGGRDHAEEPAPETAPPHGGGRDRAEEPVPETAPRHPASAAPVAAAPAARRLARELGLDIRDIVGQEPGGLISTTDVTRHARLLIQERHGARRGTPSASKRARALPDFAPYGPVERVPMSGVRRKTAQTMALSWATIPHVTQCDCADITELEQHRARSAPQAAATGGRLTLTAVVIKLVAAAVGTFPKFNASIDIDNDEIVYKKYVHIGVAVDTEQGLLVPVIRDVDKKSLLDVARELGELSARARARKSRPEELRGANLTVTNLGGLGTTYFSPLINWPEVAVLGIGRARQEAVYRDDTLIARRMLPLSLSYDHRLIDGADAARFLRWLAEGLELPPALPLER